MKGYGRLTVFFLFLGTFGIISAWKSYEGSKLLSMTPKSEAEIQALKSLMLEGHYDFWTPPTQIGNRVDIMATGDYVRDLEEVLESMQIRYDMKISDLDNWLKDNRQHNEITRDMANIETGKLDWIAYHTYEEINAWMDMMALEHPDLVTVVDAGYSYEGNAIKRMLVSTGGTDKPVIFVESGCHAREWVGPATATYIMNELITNSSAYQDSLDAIDFVFMPEVNPDGYIYTWESDRLWRKNRRRFNDSDCIGVDLNKNYDFQWEGQGAPERECSSTYRGPDPFSESETRAVRDQMLQFSDRDMVYISLHSSYEQWLRPWSYLKETPGPDEEDVLTLCEAATEASYGVHGVQFGCILGGDLYPVSGVSSDYAKGVANFKYSYTVELRDQGYGFILPPEQIIPSGEETFAAFQVVFEFIRDNPEG